MSEILIEQALLFYQEGDKPRAGALLKEVVHTDPSHIDAWYGLALCAEGTEEKIGYLRKVLELEPDHAKAQQALSKLTAEAEPAGAPKRSWLKSLFGKKA